jgi:hypothetical protein
MAALPRSSLGGGLEFSSPRLHQAQNEKADLLDPEVGLRVYVLVECRNITGKTGILVAGCGRKGANFS